MAVPENNASHVTFAEAPEPLMVPAAGGDAGAGFDAPSPTARGTPAVGTGEGRGGAVGWTAVAPGGLPAGA